jgi:hypothetical protein
MSHSPDREQPVSSQPQQATRLEDSPWPSAQPPLEDANVFLVFHGLFFFTYNPANQTCEIGVHAQAPGHPFTISIDEINLDGTTRPHPQQPPTDPSGTITLDVVMPRSQGVRFLQPPEQSEGKLDYSDWRLVPDLEGENFHNHQLNPVAGAFNPVITLNHGVFYTLLPTNCEFVRVAEHNVGKILDLEHVAFYVGGNLAHEAGGRVLLRINGQEWQLEPTDGKRYLIFFANSCPENTPQCIFDAQSSIKRERNDFHLYYRALDLPIGEQEFMMVKKFIPGQGECVELGRSPHLDFFNMDWLKRFKRFLSTHDAPCGPGSGSRTESLLSS